MPVRVRHDQAALARAARAVTPAPGLVSWGTDPRLNRVRVAVDARADDPATTALVRQLRGLGDVVSIVTAARQRQQGTVRGGETWVPGAEGACSVGFSAVGADGSRHFLTAGHCTNDADQAAYGYDGSRVGTSNTGGTHSVNAREGDFGLVDVDQPAWTLSPDVNTYGGADVVVTGYTQPVTGMSICRSGQTSGWRCGTVTAVNQSVDYGNVVIDGLFVTNACSQGGDSGGSYVTGDKAVGIHSGGGNACGQSGPNTDAQPVGEALAKWNLTLATGGTQPGTPTVAAPGDQTGTVGRAVSLTLHASGGTAPYTWSAAGLPAGLRIDASTGVVSGTPGAAGTSTVTVTARDRNGANGTASFGWTIRSSGGTTPAITDPGTQTAYVGVPVTLTIKASNAVRYQAIGLPPGLRIDAATGVISGTPGQWGLFTSTVTATGSGGATAAARFTWNVWFR
ncbi:putative Ig domain-containing protein [Actinomadura atramentaria]|uniref:putative Ig domain-containing protein n=1 Tax=Actinomadura atramentaria TaxID=1990 RepID=UPI0003625534|nr:putative Ig domain-containing protein [Actinomadura atramentaria]